MQKISLSTLLSISVLILGGTLSCAKSSQNENSSSTKTDDTANLTQLKGQRFTEDVRSAFGSFIPGGRSGTGGRPAMLGNGYDSHIGILTSDCVTGDLKYTGQMYARQHIVHNISSEDLLNTLTGNLKGSLQYGVFTGSAAVDYAHYKSSNNYSESFTDITELGGKQVVLANLRTTQVGAGQVSPIDGSIKANVEMACGNEFVKSVDVGAKLILSARFAFQNEQDKTNFSGAVSAKITGIGDLQGKIDALDSSLKQSFNIEISAYQIGGDVLALSSVFAPFVDPTAGDVNVFSCGPSSLDKCEALLKHMEDYRQNNFSTQVKDSYNPDGNAGYVILDAQTARYADELIAYKDTAINLVPKNVPQINMTAIQEKRQELTDNYENENTAYNRISDILSSFSFKLSVTQERLLRELKTTISKNKSSLIIAAESCYGDDYLASCIPDATTAIAKLLAYDSNLLNIFNDTQFAPAFDYTGFWEKSGTKITEISQKGIYIHLQDSDHEKTFSADGSYLDASHAYFTFNVTLPLTDATTGKTSYCSYFAPGQLTSFSKDRFYLQIQVPDDGTDQIKHEFNKCHVMVTKKCEGNDAYVCLPKLDYTRVNL